MLYVKCLCVVLLSQPSSRVIIECFGMCYMLNVCVLSCYLNPVVEMLIIFSVMRKQMYKKNTFALHIALALTGAQYKPTRVIINVDIELAKFN